MQKRGYNFAVGAINRTSNDRQGAHADYRAAKRVVRNCMPEIVKVVQPEGRGLVAGDVLFRLENIDVGGLVLGLFKLEYRDPMRLREAGVAESTVAQHPEHDAALQQGADRGAAWGAGEDHSR